MDGGVARPRKPGPPISALLITVVVMGLAAGVLSLIRSTRDDDIVELGQTSGESDPATSALQPGTRLPIVELEDLDGAPVSTEDLVGTPLVLNFWYAACPPCRREIPDFAAVAGDFSGRVRFVGINPVDSATEARAFADRYGMHYDNLRDPEGAALSAFEIVSFPTTLLVDGAGVIRLAHTGTLSADELRVAINETRLEAPTE